MISSDIVTTKTKTENIEINKLEEVFSQQLKEITIKSILVRKVKKLFVYLLKK